MEGVAGGLAEGEGVCVVLEGFVGEGVEVVGDQAPVEEDGSTAYVVGGLSLERFGLYGEAVVGGRGDDELGEVGVAELE
ncbi:hypothetical protein [Kribbella italica]|uniref:Uncharacterized protein n=1 Tax=Kribbella italica TaxID=1540520 RepID=A0A7W9MU91_9ACTN|nr:hypothetical protein [Kribbella italica]MBB5835982.1 hypothetical protein [Kribbella italica]